MLILDLCGGTGAWSQPYREAGYLVRVIDVCEGCDVRLLTRFPERVHGILAAPPCTAFASSGARWWKDKGEDGLLDALSVVDACLRIVAVQRPAWWALENPIGRLVKYLGPPRYRFDPCDFGEPYTKRTCLWGEFTKPVPRPVLPTQGSKMHRLPQSPRRAALRSETPRGFADAFFAVNR